MQQISLVVPVPGTPSMKETTGQVRCLFMLLAFCLFSLFAFSQRVPDPGNTYGPGTTIGGPTTTTNPNTMIPETKTDYKDANGTTRKESTTTKDFDGNNVTKEKFFDKTGNLEKETETRTDPKTGKMVYSETKEYDANGKVTKAKKYSYENGKWIRFDWDFKKKDYKDGVPLEVNLPLGMKNSACDKSPFSASVGYSFLHIANGGNHSNIPLGIDLGLDYRVNNNINAFIDISAHFSKTTEESFQRFHAFAGVEFNKENCDDNPPVSIFSRIAIGIMHDRKVIGKFQSQSGNAVSGLLGAGGDMKIGKNASLRVSGDYIPALIGGQVQHNFRLSTGLVLRLGEN